MTTFDYRKFLKENKSTFHSSLNEGQFSWMTQDTDQQIGSERENTLPFVYMHDDKGNKWLEKNYEGYGEFGGKDYYELLDQMNGGTGDRSEGIRKAFDPNLKGKVLFPALTVSSNLSPSHDFTQEAEHDPNQSWYAGEEEDYYGYNNDDDDELYENDLTRNIGLGLDYEATEEMIRDYADRLLGAGVDDVEDLANFYLDNPEDLPEPMEYNFFKNNYDDILSVAMTGLDEGEAAYEYEKGKEAGEQIEKKKMKKSELKAKIKEMIVAEMDGPAEIAKEYDFLAELEDMLNEQEDDEETDTETADAEATDEVTPEETETSVDVTTDEVDPNVKAVQDALTQAQAAAQQLGDKKLMDQIGNTITFFTRAHVVEKPKGAVSESMFPILKRILK